MSAQTKHPSRARVGRMLSAYAAANGTTISQAEDKLNEVLAMVADQSSVTADAYLAALCNSWLGDPQQRAERSDCGGFHRLPERVWDRNCEGCGHMFTSSRWDACYCSPACRQHAYRERHRTTITEEEK